ncbi:nucleotidyltransferase domain-containing protein [Tsukamurella pseudospumae]|uniref:Polymerase nucleotidyl transferase domain-containing protein n=1 Tax=Tsukamurella pseudospumae TaxID=239498 RepID=A0A137ZKQ3_9ACTN|nr:nucleotidyltransferase domain-containing protein [Tsukamurella pseudospumae]KXO98758.1 hypothetical protein AXK61_04095 [Tsukamurella pseudospumae]
MYTNEPFGGIIPGAQGAVLSALIGTGKPLTGREVHRLVSDRIGQQTTQRALHALVAMGLLTAMAVGRANLYTVNDEHIAVPALREIASPLHMLRRVIADAIGTDSEGLVAVILFGSAARGEATPDSDIDLAIITEDDENRSQRIWEAVTSRYGGKCDVLHYTPTEFAQWTHSGEEAVLQTIARDGITLWGRSPATAR